MLPACLCTLFVLGGCATVPYQYGHFRPDDVEPQEIEIQYGEPNKILDGAAWCMSLWPRLLAMNSKLNLHEVSDETRDRLVTYMKENELNDVLVRVNQYDPIGEWHRLRNNRTINAGWRYTFGICTLAQYTILPGRVFGDDQYNAYTNSLYINSDVPAVVLHEAAYAKDVYSRRMPGTYAFVNELPVVGMWRHIVGINDVLGYAVINDDWLVEEETYSVVYPVVGMKSTLMTGSFLSFWDGVILSVGSAAVGHTAGQVAILSRSKARRTHESEADSTAVEEEDEPIVQVHRNASESDEDQVQLSIHEHQMDNPQ